MIIVNGIKLYDTKEVAELFNISPTTLSNMRKRGEIRSVQIGRMKYTSEEAIKDYLNGKW